MNGELKFTHKRSTRSATAIVLVLASLALFGYVVKLAHDHQTSAKPTALPLDVPQPGFCQTAEHPPAVEKLDDLKRLGKAGYYWTKLATEHMVQEAPDGRMSATAQAFDYYVGRWPNDHSVVAAPQVRQLAADIDAYCK